MMLCPYMEAMMLMTATISDMSTVTVSEPDRLCTGVVGGDRFWSSESRAKLA